MYKKLVLEDLQEMLVSANRDLAAFQTVNEESVGLEQLHDELRGINYRVIEALERFFTTRRLAQEAAGSKTL